MEFQHIETSRLLLRHLTPEVLNYVFTQMTGLEQLDFWGFENEESLQIEKQKFEGGYTNYRISMYGFHLLDKANQQVLGSCGFHTWYPLHRRAEIGYDIRQAENRKKGLMREAMASILPFGFQTLQLNRIEAMVSPSNEDSRKLLTHFGFQQEGYLRQHYAKNERIEDSLAFSLLAEEYTIQ